MTIQLSSPKTVAIHTTLETPLQNLPTACLDIISMYLPIKDRFLFERTYPKANRRPINKIATAIKKPKVICDAEIQTLIIKDAPFAKGKFNVTLKVFITSQLSLLNNQRDDLFTHLQQTPNTDKKRAHHTTQVTAIITSNPILVLATDTNGLFNGYTPLHVTALKGHTDITHVLLANGANVDTKNSWGYTPLHWAARRGQTDIVLCLIVNGADVNAKNDEGYTPLHFSAGLGKTAASQLLIDNGADINVPITDGSWEGFTPLDIATIKGHDDVVKILTSHGAHQPWSCIVM